MHWMSCGLGVALVPSLRPRMNGFVSSAVLSIPASVCSIFVYLAHQGIKPISVMHQAFRSDALPTELPIPSY